MLVDRHGAVVLATMNRPDTRNSISESDMVEALEAVVTEVNRDRAVGALVLTGAGDGFSSGGNLKDMRDRTRMFAGSTSEVRDGYRHGIQRIPRALYDCEVPRACEMARHGHGRRGRGDRAGLGPRVACGGGARAARERVELARRIAAGPRGGHGHPGAAERELHRQVTGR